MQFLKLLFSFAPWIAFLVIAQGSLERLKIGLVVAAVLTVGMAVLKLHRGAIMWVGIAFFTYACVAVLAFTHMWTIHNMGILANAALAVGTWGTMFMGMPFTQEYAREHTAPSLWRHPAFLRANIVLTSAWGAVFTLNTAVAWLKTYDKSLPVWSYEAASYTFLLSAMVLSTVYPALMKRRAAALAAKAAQKG
jgi:hypothetical protein